MGAGVPPKKIFKVIGICVLVGFIAFSMAWLELLDRAQEAYDQGQEYLKNAQAADGKSRQSNDQKDIKDAYDNYREALWSFETVEQLLTSGTRKRVNKSELKVDMMLADGIYPDGHREAEIARQIPREMIVSSYVPLTQEHVSKIMASPGIDIVAIPKDYSLTERSGWIKLAKAEIPNCKEKIDEFYDKLTEKL